METLFNSPPKKNSQLSTLHSQLFRILAALFVPKPGRAEGGLLHHLYFSKIEERFQNATIDKVPYREVCRDSLHFVQRHQYE